MTNEELIVLTPWTGDGLSAQTAYTPMIGAVYAVDAYEDLTRQEAHSLPPAVNVLAVRVRCASAVADQIAADASLQVVSRRTLAAPHEADYAEPRETPLADVADFVARAGAKRPTIEIGGDQPSDAPDNLTPAARAAIEWTRSLVPKT